MIYLFAMPKIKEFKNEFQKFYVKYSVNIVEYTPNYHAFSYNSRGNK